MFTNIICLRKCSFSPFRLFFHCADVLSTGVPSSEVMHPWSSLLLPPFLQQGGMGFGGSGCPCVVSRRFSSPPARLWSSGQSRAGGVEEPLVACSVHGSSVLSPQFLRGLGIQELVPGSELLLPALSRLALPPQLCTLGEVLGRESFRGRSLFSVASPASSLHALRGGGAGESLECRSS